MKFYEISKGTKCLLLKDPIAPVKIMAHGGYWDTADFVTTKDLTFFDVVIDPVRIYNQTSGFGPSDTLYKLADRGYMIFQSDDNADYLLAVPYASVNVS